MTYSQALILLGVPEEERDEFVKDKDIENMSARELQQAVSEKNQALEELDNKKSCIPLRGVAASCPLEPFPYWAVKVD
nr:DUF3102 domain-containing protein [Desulfosporosinus hippei]